MLLVLFLGEITLRKFMLLVLLTSRKLNIFCRFLLAILQTQMFAKIQNENFSETDLCFGQVEKDEDKEEAQKDGEGQKCIFLNRDLFSKPSGIADMDK